MDNLSGDIKITKNAATRINAIFTGENKKGVALKISVVGRECSGMTYNLTFDKEEKEFDKYIVYIGNKILCDVISLFYVKATQIDLSNGMLSDGFK